MKPQYPIGLRLANVRRFLDARVDKKTSQVSPEDFDALIKMISDQLLPVAIREDSSGQFEVVLVERNVVRSKKNAKEWYVLACNFNKVRQAMLWCDRTLGENRYLGIIQ